MILLHVGIMKGLPLKLLYRIHVLLAYQKYWLYSGLVSVAVSFWENGMSEIHGGCQLYTPWRKGIIGVIWVSCQGATWLYMRP